MIVLDFDCAKRSVSCICIRPVDVLYVSFLCCLTMLMRVATLLYEVPPGRGRRVPHADVAITIFFHPLTASRTLLPSSDSQETLALSFLWCPPSYALWIPSLLVLFIS